jgi:3-hydroxyisobutyrate dehydrogenase-like beta-hydroxyacid dehydrogenase
MMQNKPSVAWLGAGLMGAPMAQRLLEAEYSVGLWNRSAEKAKALEAAGGQVHSTVASAIADADIVFTMLSDGAATLTVLSGLTLTDKTVVQMATIGPGENQHLQQQITNAGGSYLEAPVLGSIPEATNGKLIIMAGGEESVFTGVKPLLQCLGPEPRLVGDVGQASAMKLALNQLIASLTVAFSTSLAFAQDYGVDIEAFMAILRESALYAPTFDKKLGKMLTHDYQNPNFPTEHLIKDIKLFSKEAKQVDTQMLEVLLDLFTRAQKERLREDYSCVFEAVSRRC